MSVNKRRTPIRHPVKAHERAGVPVGDYERGKGERRIDPRRGRVVGGVSDYVVSISYVGEESESFSVDAKNFGVALKEGIELREKPLPPQVIRLRRHD